MKKIDKEVDCDIMGNRKKIKNMRIGQKLLARLHSHQLVIGDGIFNTEPKEVEVYVASIVGDRLKVSDRSGLLFPDEFILTEDGVWQSTHGWYIQQSLPTVIYHGRSLATAAA